MDIQVCTDVGYGVLPPSLERSGSLKGAELVTEPFFYNGQWLQFMGKPTECDPIIDGVMELRSGARCLIDKQSEERVRSLGRWRAVDRGCDYVTFEIRRRTNIGKKTIYLHRWITNCPSHLHVDHING